MDQNQHVLITGYVWPEPASSAAGQRMMQLIDIFKENEWEVTFASAAAESEHHVDLVQQGIDKVHTTLNSSEFDEFLKELNPSIVVFDRFLTEEQFGWRVERSCPGALRLLDTEDLHCLRKARKRAVEEQRPFRREELLTDEVALREIAAIYRSDLSLIISDTEMELLEALFGVDSSLLHYLPFLMQPLGEEKRRRWPDYGERSHYVTIGNFRHDPNMDSVVYLKEEIWPKIRNRQPEAELYVYGAYPSDRAVQLQDADEGFYVEGRVADAREKISRSRVMLAPLRFGAGIKGKLVEAMECGTPSVTTPVGAEGIAGDMEWPGRVAEDPEEIAAAAVELYGNLEKWIEAQQKASLIVNARFRRDEHLPLFRERLSELMEHLQEHRRRNFIGAMLRHHTVQSTRFMSKWIEAKNK